MGISDKLQVEGALETEAQKWVIAGISLRTALRPVRTKRPGKQTTAEEEDDDGEDHVDAEEACSTTPTGDESRIPARMSCPPAPRKHRICSSFSTSSSRSHHNEVKEFFTPPDLDSVFVRRVESTK